MDFPTVGGLINAGEYDDFTNPRQRSMGPDRGRSRSRARQLPGEVSGPSTVPPGTLRQLPDEVSGPSTVPPGTRHRNAQRDESGVDQVQSEAHVRDGSPTLGDLLDDPECWRGMKRVAGSSPLPGETAYNRPRRPERKEMQSLYVDKTELENLIFWVGQENHHFALSVEIPMPSTESEWKQILKNPSKFSAKSLHKGAEVSWTKLNGVQKAAMDEAKQLEVAQWLREAVVARYRGVIPQSRLLRMRWVLTLKPVEHDANLAKCKARIVLLGYSDPDLLDLQTAAPTLIRRSRQLMLSMCTHQRWALQKADAKSAFLQGAQHQGDRNVFTIPVPELAAGLGIPNGEAVKLLKSAYGLASAPRDWFIDVKNVLVKCGFTQCKSDPCLFLLSHENKTCGLIAMHVDDFVLAGEESNGVWTQAVEQFRKAFRWSPWEQPPFTHCGVEVHQLPDFSFKLGHSSYCEELKQIEIDKASSDITDGERSQARALLGAAQWRVQQTAPQHAAKLSMLQSLLPRGGKDVLTAINKLCREIYAQRHLSVATLHLGHDSPEELVFVCWTDAAVGNRPDMSSTGGYLVGLASPQLLSGQRGPVNPIAWRSGKLHRVARSSLSAEIQALAEGEQELMACRLQWAEMLGRAPDLRQPWQTVATVPAAAVVDAKSVWDAFQKGDTATSMFSMKEKYAALELMAVEESMTRTNTPLLWVSSEAQLADGLTKSQAQDLLRDFLQRGQLWNVKYDPNFLAAKKKRHLTKEPQLPPESEDLDEASFVQMSTTGIAFNYCFGSVSEGQPLRV